MIFTRLHNYKDLFLVLIWREFNIRYKQSVLGILWVILQPLSMMLLFTMIFTFIMPIQVSRHPFPLFFYSGLIFWSFFTASLNYAIPCLKIHYNLVTKIYFPKELLPLSGIVVAFIDLIIASLILMGMMFFYKVQISLAVLWVLPLVLLLFVFTTAISLLLSALNVLYKDISLASNFLIQLWFFATPVMYSLDKAPPEFRTLLFLNPLTFIIENLRICLLEARGITAWQYALMAMIILVFFLASYKIFIITERKFADVI